MTASMRAGEYQNLLKHMEWADALVWTAVLGLPAARDDARLRERLHHLHVVQWVYLQVWRGEPIRAPELGTFADLDAVAAWARSCYPKLREFARRVKADELAQRIEFPWAGEVVTRLGSAGPATLGESVLQVVMHSTYHRGQIAARIRELGGEPPLTDFIAWIWKERPDPAWPPAGA
jgi:uncharacterized damage-inducible protein DinB